MADKKLAGVKVLMVVAPEQFRDEELLVPQRIFADAGADVVVASPNPGEAKGMLGARIQPDALLKDVDRCGFDAVVVVGGMGSPAYLWDDQDLHGLLRQMHDDGKVISAICLSGAVLARAGVLEGKRATVWPMPESLEALSSGGAAYEETPVVQDGRVITASGPAAASEFGRLIAGEISRSTSGV